MVYDYVVTLENRNRRYIDNVSVLLILLSVVYFIREILGGGSVDFDLNKKIGWGWDITNFTWWQDRKFLLIGTVLVIFLFALNLYRFFSAGKKVEFSRTLLIAGIVWLSLSSLFWIGLPLIALGLLEKLAKNDLEIGFSTEQVVINSLIKRRFIWTDFNNIMLKDDLLTMDFKNNKLLQRMTIDDESDADEDEFNIYCRQHLSPGK